MPTTTRASASSAKLSENATGVADNSMSEPSSDAQATAALDKNRKIVQPTSTVAAGDNIDAGKDTTDVQASTDAGKNTDTVKNASDVQPLINPGPAKNTNNIAAKTTAEGQLSNDSVGPTCNNAVNGGKNTDAGTIFTDVRPLNNSQPACNNNGIDGKNTTDVQPSNDPGHTGNNPAEAGINANGGNNSIHVHPSAGNTQGATAMVPEPTIQKPCTTIHLSTMDGISATPSPAPASRFTDDPVFSAAFGESNGALLPGAAQLAAKLDNVRAIARERDFYAAFGPPLMKHLTWISEGSGCVVVDKAAGIATMEAHAAHAADLILNPKPPSPELAPMYIIGNVASNCCFLQPDGNYKSPDKQSTTFSRDFSKTTLACALVAPPQQYPDLQHDYARALETVSALIKHFNPPSTGAVFTRKDMQDKHLRLRHKVFEKMSSNDAIAPTADLPCEFQMAAWPVNEDAKDARDALINSHFTSPLPAFDVNAQLIPPSKYVSELAGATVLVGFCIVEFYVKGKHNVCLEIQYMRVLIPPTGNNRATPKRNALQMTDPFSRASEKRRAL